MEYKPLEITKQLVTFSDMMACDELSVPERVEAAANLDNLLITLAKNSASLNEFSDLIDDYMSHPDIDGMSLLSFTDAAVVKFVNSMRHKYAPNFFTMYRKYWLSMLVQVLDTCAKLRKAVPNSSLIVFDDLHMIEFYYQKQLICRITDTSYQIDFACPLDELNAIIQHDTNFRKLILLTDLYNKNMNSLFNV